MKTELKELRKSLKRIKDLFYGSGASQSAWLKMHKEEDIMLNLIKKIEREEHERTTPKLF